MKICGGRSSQKAVYRGEGGLPKKVGLDSLQFKRGLGKKEWVVFLRDGRLKPNVHYKSWKQCAQVHQLPQNHCDDKRESTLFS